MRFAGCPTWLVPRVCSPESDDALRPRAVCVFPARVAEKGAKLMNRARRSISAIQYSVYSKVFSGSIQIWEAVKAGG